MSPRSTMQASDMARAEKAVDFLKRTFDNAVGAMVASGHDPVHAETVMLVAMAQHIAQTVQDAPHPRVLRFGFLGVLNEEFQRRGVAE